MSHKAVGYRINILIARLCFRGIYFPSMGRFAWLKAIAENRKTILKLIREGIEAWRGTRSLDTPPVSVANPH
jgi:cytochrome b